MAVNLSPIGGVAGQFFTNNGTPLSGGKIYTYAAGSSTPATTYTTAAGNVAHTNPIVLDSGGRVPTGEIWLTDGVSYKFVIKTSADVLIGTYDNIVGINSNFVNYTNQQDIQTATAGQTLFTLPFSYAPGTNSLSVFVDGVNQYGPGAQYAYVETSSTEITFVNGLHVGAEVKFTTSQLNSSASGDASQVSYTPPFIDSVATNVAAKLAQTVSVVDFGAVGDWIVNGVINPTPTDNLAAFEAAFAAFKNVTIPPGYYYLSDILTLPRYSVMTGQDAETYLITNSSVAVISAPLGNDQLTFNNIKFASLHKGSAIWFGNPAGTDYSTGNKFYNCTFTNSLGYTFVDKGQLISLFECSVDAPIYLIDGNYLTVDHCYFVWNDVSTTKASIAGKDFGAAVGSGYFGGVAPIRIDGGHSAVINNNWFEHITTCSFYSGTSVIGFTYTNNKHERCSNSPTSQSTIGAGYYVQINDSSNILEGGLISGNTFIGNVGTYSDATTFTPDCIGALGGSGIKKCSVFGNQFGFFETAKAPVGGYKVSQYLPLFSDAYATGQYVNDATYSIAPAPATGKVGAFQAIASGTQSIPDSTWTLAVATNVIFDTNGWYIPTGGVSEYRPEVAGYYRFTGSVQLASVPDAKHIELAIYKNGSPLYVIAAVNNGAPGNMMVSGSVSIYTTATAGALDLYQLYVYQASGGPLSTIATVNAVRFEAELIGY